MERSTDRILTTHIGSLPRPPDLIAQYQGNAPASALEPRLKSAVREVVKQQVDAGIDVVNDGEYGKAMRAPVDHGAWWSYIYERLAGFEVREGGAYRQNFGPLPVRIAPIFASSTRRARRMAGGGSSGGQQASASSRLAQMVCTGPVKYTGKALIERDVRDLKDALDRVNPRQLFMTAVSPATLQILPNSHYASQEEHTWAVAEAIGEEYRAIVDAGFVLQIDDPTLVGLYDWWFSQTADISGYRKWAAFQVDAVNHALEGIPQDRVRFHICWGSRHGPHSTDLELKAVIDLLLMVNAQGYSVEAGNVRHEHE